MKENATSGISPFVYHLVLADDPHDRLLVQNCHPPGHVNPMPSGKYNLVAIGAGAAGLVSSGGAGSLGARSALVERGLTGGDCLVTGCVPSKALIRAARAVYDLRRAREFGIRFPVEPEVSFAAAMERMRRLRAHISSADSVARFSDKFKVDVFLGNAKFTGPDSLEVEGARLYFARAILAAGGRPLELPIPGLPETGYYTNETIFTLTELPRRIVVIGAGPVGCELAQSFRRFGARVTMIHNGDRILPREDADASAILERQFGQEGIAFCHQARVLRAERRGADRVIFYAHRGQECEISCDLILVAAGRAPNVERLGLEAAGVKYSHAGVLVDDYLRTSNPRIYAAGDICLQHKFTHAADASARLALRNALFFPSAKFSSLVMPWVSYTDPEIAHTGMYEAGARAAGYDVATLTESFGRLDRAILDGEDEGLARVHYDRKSGRLLGGTIVARHAGEMISELTLAISLGAKIDALANTIHPYPTQAEVLRKLGDAYNRTRLRPAVARIFERWFTWKRRG